MLISRTYKSNFINYKNKINIFENFYKKLILIILFLFLTSFYLLSKTTNIFTESKLYSLDKILIKDMIKKYQFGKKMHGIGKKRLPIGVMIGVKLPKNIYIQNTPQSIAMQEISLDVSTIGLTAG